MVEPRKGTSQPQDRKRTNDPLRSRRAHAVRACVALTATGLALVAEAAGPAPTFAPATKLPTGGMQPYGVAIADVNADGKADLVSTNYQSGTFAVRLGDGLGSFGAVTTFPSGGTGPLLVAVADVNGDGKPDLVTSHWSSGTLAVLLGDGLGSFGTATTFPSGGDGPIAAAVSDVSGDGKPDLVCANRTSASLTVRLGDGLGGFGAAATFPTGGSAPQSVAIADVSGDGKADLVSADRGSGTLSVLLGNGFGSFGAATTFPTGGVAPYGVAVADVNGDGKPDLVSSNFGSHTLAVLLGNGLGSFGTAVTFPVSATNPYGVVVADVNGDGKPDLVSPNYTAHNLSVLTGDGLGGFGAATTFPTGGDNPTSVAVSDVNGDGHPDLASANYFSQNLSVLLNTTPTDTTPPTGTPQAVGTGGASNGQAYIPVHLQDAGSGVKQVQLTANSSNVHFEYPLGTVKTSPLTFSSPLADVTVYAVKDSNAKARVELKVTDAAGNVGVVDPIVATLELKKSGQLTRTFKQLPQAERYVRLQNGTPGFKNARLWINGKVVSKGNLTDGQTVDLDVVEWLKPGTRNTAKITASGPKGAKAILTIGDVATGSGAALRALSGGTMNVEFSR